MTEQMQQHSGMRNYVQQMGVCCTPVSKVQEFTGTCVYVHRRATDGQVFYVGMGSRLRSRAKVGRSVEWQAVATEHGRLVQVVEVFEEYKDAAEAEKETIDLLTQLGAPLVNKSTGGEGGRAYAMRTVEQAYLSVKHIVADRERATLLRMTIERWRATVLRNYVPLRRRGETANNYLLRKIYHT